MFQISASFCFSEFQKTKKEMVQQKSTKDLIFVEINYSEDVIFNSKCIKPQPILAVKTKSK